MLLWETPITDRTQTDADRVKELYLKGWQGMSDDEKEEWLGNLKGALNKSDLERINNNIELCNEVLELDLKIEEPPVMTESYLKNLLDNVTAIWSASAKHSDTPTPPKEPLTTYQKWNDIEKILLDIYEILLNNFYYYCEPSDGLYCGGDIGLLL
jgi:hypothetical protein